MHAQIYFQWYANKATEINKEYAVCMCVCVCAAT